MLSIKRPGNVSSRTRQSKNFGFNLTLQERQLEVTQEPSQIKDISSRLSNQLCNSSPRLHSTNCKKYKSSNKSTFCKSAVLLVQKESNPTLVTRKLRTKKNTNTVNCIQQTKKNKRDNKENLFYTPAILQEESNRTARSTNKAKKNITLEDCQISKCSKKTEINRGKVCNNRPLRTEKTKQDQITGKNKPVLFKDLISQCEQFSILLHDIEIVRRKQAYFKYLNLKRIERKISRQLF